MEVGDMWFIINLYGSSLTNNNHFMNFQKTKITEIDGYPSSIRMDYELN